MWFKCIWNLMYVIKKSVKTKLTNFPALCYSETLNDRYKGIDVQLWPRSESLAHALNINKNRDPASAQLRERTMGTFYRQRKARTNTIFQRKCFMAGMILQAQWDTEHIKEKKWEERKRIRKRHKEKNLTLTAKTNRQL